MTIVYTPEGELHRADSQPFSDAAFPSSRWTCATSSCCWYRYLISRVLTASASHILKLTIPSGDIRSDVDGLDLFALVNAVAWIADQAPSIAERKEHLVALVMDGLRHRPPLSTVTGDESQATQIARRRSTRRASG